MKNIIMCKNYGFRYAGAGRDALQDVNLELQEGGFYLLIGASGCGKSTLLRQLKNSIRPAGSRSGKLLVDGRAPEAWEQRQESAEIGFVQQDPDAQIVTDKVWHELAFGLESLGYDTPVIRMRTAEMASYFGIQQWFRKEVTELSGGQKQMLNLASVMVMHPKLLLLDEPTSQLDPIAAADFLRTIRKINEELGTTIFMTEHRLEEVYPMADRVILMEQGTVAATGSPEQTAAWMFRQGHPLFCALPAPARIALQYGEADAGLPLTVREGRRWLQERLAAEATSEDGENRYMDPDIPAGEDPQDVSRKKKTASQNIPAGKDPQDVSRRNPAADQDTPAGQKSTAGRRNTGSGRSRGTAEKPEVLLEARDVWFRYDRELPDVLRGLSMKLYRGEIFCLLGGNGTGKSTALSLLSGLQQPYRGRILLENKDLRKYRDRELYTSCLGMVPQNPQSLFVRKTVREELFEMIGGPRQRLSEEFPVDMDKKEVVEQMALLCHLESLLEQHPFDLSGGEQQRVALAKILLLRPKLLLMDEPTKGMDAGFKEEFADILRRLKQSGVTILMVSHDIEFCARYADRCAMFFDGSIVTENEPHVFFAGNTFYTTATNRMAGSIWPEVITVEEFPEIFTGQSEQK